MPILSNFPYYYGGGGIALASVSDIATIAASGKVYIKWTDPNNIISSESILAEWGGTLLVRKAGSMPANRRDGTIVIDSTTKNQYSNSYFCDSGLSDGTTYYYKFFPYTTTGTYTDSEDDEFTATPTAQVPGIDSWNVTNIVTSEEAGDGKMTIKWSDPPATITSDGVTLATWGSTTVVVKTDSYATSKDDASAVYTLKVTTRNQYASTPLTVTGLTNGTTYYISFFPETTDGGINTSTTQRSTGIANRITIPNIPSQSDSLTYTGSSQSPTWSNYNTTYMTIGGTTYGTNAGSYNATFTPKTDYRWSDGTTTAKTVSWSIGKATGTLTVSESSIELNSSTLSATFTIGGNYDGTLSVVSNDTGIATVSLSGSTVTVTHVNQTTGSTTITVSCTAGTNYTAPADKTVTVNAEFVSNVLNENSWEVIKAVSDSGQGDNYWDVGDTKTIVINGKVGATTFSNLSIDAFIIGFHHNASIEGNNRIHFQLGKIGGKMVGLIDSRYSPDNGWNAGSSNNFVMNISNTNSGGWNISYMRKIILSNTYTPTSQLANNLMKALPADLRAVMKSVTKYTDNTAFGVGNQSSYVTATTDYLWLLAEFEVHGTRSYANQYEQNYQAQYQYYKSGNSKVAYKYNATGTAVDWWLRSARSEYIDTFCIVGMDDDLAYDGAANYSLALLPCFAV